MSENSMAAVVQYALKARAVELREVIGLLSLALAKLSGAGWLGVIGLNQDEKRLSIAKSFGVDLTITGGESELLEVVRSLGDGLGVDVVIEASGASSALKPALAAVPPGGQIAKVGWGPQPLEFSLDPLVRIHQTRRKGVLCSKEIQSIWHWWGKSP